MIKKLQRKFVFIVMTSLLAVMLVIVGAINIVNYCKFTRSADSMLALLSENNGSFPMQNQQNSPPAIPEDTGSAPQLPQTGTADSASGSADSSSSQAATPFDQSTAIQRRNDKYDRGPMLNAETPFKTRFFTVTADADGKVTDTMTESIAAVDSDSAAALADKVLSDGKTAGFSGIYRYRVTATETGHLVVFLDCGDEIQSNLSLLWITLGVAFIALVAMFVLVSVFSRRATRPVAESIEKQRQFITDAGHEIKTPLAIISANADVLELTAGEENEWVHSIKNQTKRLGVLVGELIALSKTDEDRPKVAFSRFDLSEAVSDTVKPFAVLADAQKKSFSVCVEPGIFYDGCEDDLRKLVSILTDNAIKYAAGEGLIRITLARRGKGISLEVFNTCEPIPKEQLSRLFDRFYRLDSSRSRETGGYGIGLSMAKAIVTAHKGKITARSEEEGTVCFAVLL